MTICWLFVNLWASHNQKEELIHAKTSSTEIESWDILAVINITIELETSHGFNLNTEEIEALQNVKTTMAILKANNIKYVFE